MKEGSANDSQRIENGLCEDGENGRESLIYRREIDIYRREKEIAERELELGRREIALLREHRNIGSVDRSRPEEAIARSSNNAPALPHLRSNLTAVADLLSNFDGDSDFDT